MRLLYCHSCCNPRCQSLQLRSAVLPSNLMLALPFGASNRRKKRLYFSRCPLQEDSREDGRLLDCAVLVAAGITQGVSVVLFAAESLARVPRQFATARPQGRLLILSDRRQASMPRVNPPCPASPGNAICNRMLRRMPHASACQNLWRIGFGRTSMRQIKRRSHSLLRHGPLTHQNSPCGPKRISATASRRLSCVGQRIKLHATNSLVRNNRVLKCRTHAASIFPNAASWLCLVSALLAESDEEWMTGKIYLNLKD